MNASLTTSLEEQSMDLSHSTLGLCRALFCAAALALTLGACGGGGDPPPLLPPATIVGAAGGTVSGPGGAQVVIPAGALAANTAIAVTASTTGNPALPTGVMAAGPVFAFTPHGTTFAQAVTVTVPVDPSVPAGVAVKLYKTMNGAAGPWEEVVGATRTGNLVSAQVTSFSLIAPTITLQPADQSVIAPAAATFSVTALGVPPFAYRWEKSDNGGMTFAAAPGVNNAMTYTTAATSVAADNGDRYHVLVATDDNGNGMIDAGEAAATSNSATLTVTAVVVAPTITTQPQSVSGAIGNASFSVVATGTDLVYQWHKNGVPLAGQTNASFNLVNVQASDAGDYTVVVSNLVNGVPINSVTSNVATLTVTTGALNLTGIWITNFTCTGSGGNFSGTETLTVTHTGTNVNFTTQPDGGTFTGTLTGNTMNYSGSAPGYTESGTWTLVDANNFTKTSNYVDTGGTGGSCPGTGQRQ
jgi:hypothetical protein